MSRMEKVIMLMATDPIAAATELDKLANELRGLADDLRQGNAPGGMGDRVKMQVIGPGGELKQYIDTGRN